MSSNFVRVFDFHQNQLLEKKSQTIQNMVKSLKHVYQNKPYVIPIHFQSFLDWIARVPPGMKFFQVCQQGRPFAFYIIHQDKELWVMLVKDKNRVESLCTMLKFLNSLPLSKIRSIKRFSWDRRAGEDIQKAALKLKFKSVLPSFWYEGKISSVVKIAKKFSRSTFRVSIVENGIHQRVQQLPEELKKWGSFLFFEKHKKNSGLILVTLEKNNEIAGIGFGIISKTADEKKYDGFYGWKKRLGKNGVLLRSFIIQDKYRLSGGLNEIFCALSSYIQSKYSYIKRMGGDTREPNMVQALTIYGFKFPFASHHSEFVCES